MEDSHRAIQQFYTDERGVHYSRYGNNSPWRQISPHRHPAQVRDTMHNGGGICANFPIADVSAFSYISGSSIVQLSATGLCKSCQY